MAIFLVQVSEDSGKSSLQEFATVESLVASLKKLVDVGGSRFYVFDGKRLKVSKAPFRYLLVDEQRYPLFDLPDSFEEDPEMGCSSKEVDVPIDDDYASLSQSAFDDEEALDAVDATAPGLPDLGEQHDEDDASGFDDS